MLEQRSDSLQVNTAQSQARVMSLEQEKVHKRCSLTFCFIIGVVYQLIVEFPFCVVAFAFIAAPSDWIHTLCDIRQSQENLKLVVTC